VEIKTERLLLRQFRDDDLPSLSKINDDPTVMEFIGPRLNDNQSKAMFERSRLSWNENGFGKFAVEVPGEADFIGYVGLASPPFQSHFTPCVEIGWRLASQYWGHGYATEAAEAVRHFAFNSVGLLEIVSFTTPRNLQSQRVMEKIGLIRDSQDDFEHPNKSKDDALRIQVLYRGTRNSRN
jgi:RimJ/RimL family protein N-acetyltransferase